MAELFYDLLGLVGFAHPLHPVLITMVVGPVIASFLFAAIAFFFHKPDFYKTSRQLTVVAFLFWFPTVAVGIIDWVHFYGGSTNMAEINAKLVLAGILFLLLLGNILLFKAGQKQPLIPLILMLFAAANVSALGFYGGEIVFGSGKKTEVAASAGSTAVNEAGYKTLSQEGFDLAWKIYDGLIDVKLSYQTNGWVGFGIGNTGTMEGSHIILGFVMDGKAVVEDHFGLGGTEHVPQGELGAKDSLKARSGTYENGKTTIAFTMPLNTGNPLDPVLVEGETYQVILANGGEGAQDLQTYHGRSGRIIVELKL